MSAAMAAWIVQSFANLGLTVTFSRPSPEEEAAVSAYYCPACYGRRDYCGSCKTYHCRCSWARCPKPAR